MSFALRPRPLPRPPPSVEIDNTCEVTMTEDMYGIGLRVGAYLASSALILSTILIPEGAKHFRGANVIFAFALSIAFLCQADITVLALEYPVFMSLEMILLFPTVIEPFFRLSSKNFFETVVGKGSYIAAAVVLAESLFAGLWALTNRWDTNIPSRCDVVSGLAGIRVEQSASSGLGKTQWTAMISLGFALGFVSIVFAIFTLMTLYRLRVNANIYKAPHNLTQQDTWIKQRNGLIFWLVVVLPSTALSIATVETTIEMNGIQVSPLGDSLGQLIALIVGIGSLVQLVWRVIEIWKYTGSI